MNATAEKTQLTAKNAAYLIYVWPNGIPHLCEAGVYADTNEATRWADRFNASNAAIGEPEGYEVRDSLMGVRIVHDVIASLTDEQLALVYPRAA